jgi:serine protease AprX
MSLTGAAPLAPTAMTRVIVQGRSLDAAVAAVSANGGQVAAKIDIINAVVADVPQANLARLAKTTGVVRVTLDRPVKLASHSGGNGDEDVLYDFPKVVGADRVQDHGNFGQGVTVAFLDTGIDPTFVSLRIGPGTWSDRFLAYYDAINNQLYGPTRLLRSPRDPNGHGTHVAGIIANSDRDHGDFRGLAPGVKFVAVRVLDETGTGTYANVLQGLNWIVQNKNRYNIRVLNMSMYATPVAPYWADPYNLAVMAAWQAGIVVVASAGNGGPAPLSIGVPGNTPYIITVGAFTDNYTPSNFGDDYMPPFSATGPTLDAFVKPDLIAPGAHMASLMRNNSYLAQQYPANRINGHYFKMSGTSMSAATVSGIVALMLHQHPELTPDQVKYRLTMTARPQFSEYSGQAAYSIWQQGAGRVWAPDAVNDTTIQGAANQGMDIAADLAGTTHYEGWTTYDPATGEFRIRDDGYNSWAGGYNSWAGGYNSWAGGYNSWAGGTTNWSGGFNSWAGGYNSWAGGYNSWAGGYNSWAGGYNSWAGGYNSWAGGYNSWAGGYSSWAGGYNSWAGGYNSWAGGVGNPSWAATFANLQNVPTGTSAVSINYWVDDDN